MYDMNADAAADRLVELVPNSVEAVFTCEVTARGVRRPTFIILSMDEGERLEHWLLQGDAALNRTNLDDLAPGIPSVIFADEVGVILGEWVEGGLAVVAFCKPPVR